MWLVEMLGVSLVLGVIGGVAWRLGEDWWEKRQREQQ